MVLTKSAFSAANLLIDIGYFPVHVNLDLLKSNIPIYSDEIVSAAESLLAESSDPDEVSLFAIPNRSNSFEDLVQIEVEPYIKNLRLHIFLVYVPQCKL